MLLVFDTKDNSPDFSILPNLVKNKLVICIRNKIYLSNTRSEVRKLGNQLEVSLSAKNGDGVDLLRKTLAEFAGLNSDGEGVFLARKRHIDSIDQTLIYINSALEQLEGGASELVAEDLRQAGMSLGQITGEFSSDDLLGEIFSSFCIGK